MPFHRTISVFPARAFLASLVLFSSGAIAKAADVPIQVVAYHWQAAGQNENPAYLLVQLSNADGSAKIDAVLPKPKPNDPTSGLELKGSSWSFETLLVPDGYSAVGIQTLRPATFFDPAVTQPVKLPGQLRLMQVAPAFRTASDPHRGLYYFTIMPMVGFQGQQKQLLKWITGEYLFRITYNDGTNQGSAIGMLRIP